MTLDCKKMLLPEREKQICYQRKDKEAEVVCDVNSLAGALSQRGCVYCGARVVLNPITDAAHLVHGPIGCAAYTWDIRGSLTSGPDLYRNSFSTDMQEKDVIFGGEAKLAGALRGIIRDYRPQAVFVYATCIAGIIGDDLQAVCKQIQAETGIRVIPVQSEGFMGNKSAGYRAACDALLKLIGTHPAPPPVSPLSINILGEFNLAGELWVIKNYLEALGIEVVSTLTGDGRVDEIARAHTAKLNVVQCAGSMTYLAKKMKEKYGIPYLQVSFAGLQDTEQALLDIAQFFANQDEEIVYRARRFCIKQRDLITWELQQYKQMLKGKKAAVYMGGAFKTISLIKMFRDLGMEVVIAGSQTGKAEEYKQIQRELGDTGVIIDDAGALELSAFLAEFQPDVLVGGVKERPLAYKAGKGFVDFNHERKKSFAGYEGMLNFAREVAATVLSPVWPQLVTAARMTRSDVYG